MYLLSSLLELAKVNRPFNHGIFYSQIIEVKKISYVHIIVVEKNFTCSGLGVIQDTT